MQSESDSANTTKQQQSEAIEIPYQRLASETLQAVVEEYITREGTDYGENEIELKSKVAQAMQQLACGEVKIVFYPETAHCQIIPA